MAKTTNDNLLTASQKVLELAAQRRKRMATAAAPAAKVAAKPAAPAAKVAPKAPVKAETAPAAVVEAPKVETAPAPVETTPAAVAPVAPAAVVEAPKPEIVPAAAAPVKATENGGFSDDMSKVKESDSDVGAEDWGVRIPPEIETEVEDGKDDMDDDMPLPGILIPEGLEDSVMAVVDPSLFNGDVEVRFDMVPFIATSAKTSQEILNAGAHWVVFANGDPLAKISLKDQDHADKIVAHFVSADFARSVVDGIQKRGVNETLIAVKAKAYVAKVDEAKKVIEIKAKLEASAEEAVRQRIASIKAKYVENIGLVLEAASNNFIVENPVKDGFIAAMAQLGIPEAAAAQMADDVFFQFGKKTLAGFLDKAESWANMAPDALREVKAAMQSAGRRQRPLPSQMGAAHTNPNYNQQLANQMAASAVPVVSSSTENAVSASHRVNSHVPVEPSKKDEMRSRIGSFRMG